MTQTNTPPQPLDLLLGALGSMRNIQDVIADAAEGRKLLSAKELEQIGSVALPVVQATSQIAIGLALIDLNENLAGLREELRQIRYWGISTAVTPGSGQ